jgi:redox-sensitive bicupin YhaK (pirin superfamily)
VRRRCYAGARGPLTDDVPGLTLLDVFDLRSNAKNSLWFDVATERQHVLVYVYRGGVVVGDAEGNAAGDITLMEGEFAPLTPGIAVQLRAARPQDNEPRRGGGPDVGRVGYGACIVATAPRVDEPVFVWSGFAMQSREALDQAVQDLHNGKAATCG